MRLEDLSKWYDDMKDYLTDDEIYHSFRYEFGKDIDPVWEEFMKYKKLYHKVLKRLNNKYNKGYKTFMLTVVGNDVANIEDRRIKWIFKSYSYSENNPEYIVYVCTRKYFDFDRLGDVKRVKLLLKDKDNLKYEFTKTAEVITYNTYKGRTVDKNWQ